MPELRGDQRLFLSRFSEFRDVRYDMAARRSGARPTLCTPQRTLLVRGPLRALLNAPFRCAARCWELLTHHFSLHALGQPTGQYA